MSGEGSNSTDADGLDRRSFLRRMGKIGLFTVPVVTTLSMSNVGDAFGASSASAGVFGNSHGPFGNRGNQHYFPGGFGNQTE